MLTLPLILMNVWIVQAYMEHHAQLVMMQLVDVSMIVP